MIFSLRSEIAIGSFKFKGVHGVHIKKSIHSMEEAATIVLPAKAKLVRNGKTTPEVVSTNQQFEVGSEVTIQLGYNNAINEEFRGFVKSVDMNSPVTVQCEGYSFLLKRTNISISRADISVKDLLELALADVSPKIDVVCDVEMQLSNVQIEGTAFDVVSTIGSYTDGCLRCFFIEPNKLWCGFIYSKYAQNTRPFSLGKVKFRSGYNVPKSNTLEIRKLTDFPVKVTYGKRVARGEYINGVSDSIYGVTGTYRKTLNQVTQKVSLEALANEKAAEKNYKGYSGKIKTFLQPFVRPGDEAQMYNGSSGAFEGTYLIESVETRFGINGAVRDVELGIKTNKENEQ